MLLRLVFHFYIENVRKRKKTETCEFDMKGNNVEKWEDIKTDGQTDEHTNRMWDIMKLSVPFSEKCGGFFFGGGGIVLFSFLGGGSIPIKIITWGANSQKKM